MCDVHPSLPAKKTSEMSSGSPRKQGTPHNSGGFVPRIATKEHAALIRKLEERGAPDVAKKSMTVACVHLLLCTCKWMGQLRSRARFAAVVIPYRGARNYVFTNRNDPSKPLSDGAVNGLLKRLGYRGRQTTHGFRHLISTALNEHQPNGIKSSSN